MLLLQLTRQYLLTPFIFRSHVLDVQHFLQTLLAVVEQNFSLLTFGPKLMNHKWFLFRIGGTSFDGFEVATLFICPSAVRGSRPATPLFPVLSEATHKASKLNFYIHKQRGRCQAFVV